MIRLVNHLEKILDVSKVFKRYISKNFEYHEEVVMAMKTKKPIVALESTIITHGMPYPDNLNTAIEVENIVRTRGAVPATIGIINGQIHVGLNKTQIQNLAEESCGPKSAIKCSQRDICSLVAGKLHGGTTVGGTVTIAHLAGISVMATGGIGGVHRGVEQTFDISSDLVVLGKTPVAVICAGVKAILDIPKTLEFLETLSVPVISIGEDDTFPAFYSRRTSDSIKSPSSILTTDEAAECIRAQRSLGINSGLIFAVPLPESVALDSSEIEKFIDMAIRECDDKCIRGKSVTPYLLKRLTDLTEGRSLTANKVLIKNNAAVAADIAVKLSKLSEEKFTNVLTSSREEQLLGFPVVIGGVTEDTTLAVEEPAIQFDGRTHKGKRRQSFGGVGRNIAAALIAIGIEKAQFLSVVGDDNAGVDIIRSLPSAEETIDKLSDKITARYTGVTDKNGECKFGFGEMDIFKSIDADFVKKNYSRIEAARLVVLDGNLPTESISEVINIAVQCQVPIWYEPTDAKKACKIFESHSEWQTVLHFISPNIKELFTIGEYFSIKSCIDESKNSEIDIIKDISEKLGRYVPVIMTTLGSNGLLVVRKSWREDLFYLRGEKNKISLIENDVKVQSRIYSPLSTISVESKRTYSVSGCGDCLAAGVISGIMKGMDEASCVNLGLKAAGICLESLETVPKTLINLR
ncbi:hypothetical protein HCN44_011004 [Aphidius gifuensis]|uniref:Carbohydrate kinase PfkB domain-containing protein n=2 Tax=Aphidius gifuensis TaxID=684658 RepID=A0A834Y922_APHGI|nr:hypothetical protein HCN44_011004 [Aphidius gifuensis]